MDPLAPGYRAVHRMTALEDVGALRRMARALALTLGASDSDCARVELVTTELGTNTLQYARPPGYMLLQPLAPPHGRGLEILAVDHGPGIRDLPASRSELASWGSERRPQASDASLARLVTRFDPSARARGLGCGLASVRRQASEFDIHSQWARGTVVLARIFFGPAPAKYGFRVGAVSVPVLGELENGDAWAFIDQRAGCAALVADGLGHGPAAALASGAATAMFRQQGVLDADRYFHGAHEALRGTRGAAVSLCRIFAETGRVLFAGVGNVEGRIHRASGSAGLLPCNGTLGMNLHAPKVELRELVWEPGATLVLHSDGLRHYADLTEHGDLARRDPAVIAAVLHRDLARPRDDATVMVVQDTRRSSA